MALLVNFAAIEMSTYLNKWYYVKLGTLVLISSIIVTLVNRYLIRHEKSDIVIIDDISDELALEEAATESEDSETVNSTLPAKTNEKVAVIPKEDKLKSTANDKFEPDSDIETEVKVKVPPKFLQPTTDIEKSNKSVEIKKIDTNIPVKTAEVQQTDTKLIAAVSTDTKKDEIKQLPTSPEKSAAIQQTDTEIAAPITTDTKKSDTKQPFISLEKTGEKFNKPIDKKEIKSVEDVKIKPVTDEKVENTQSKSQDKQLEKNKDKLLDIKAHLGSLDDILDYAYAQRTSGDLEQAILAYQKALDRYRSDDYAPFIAIDLGNIYKEQAAYSKVIKTYEEALKLPVVMRNADTRKEFNKNLTYMRIVQSVLVRHRALTMPFSKIPKQYLQEVETEFKSLQLNHSTVQKRY